jgi:hypothetical protein
MHSSFTSLPTQHTAFPSAAALLASIPSNVQAAIVRARLPVIVLFLLLRMLLLLLLYQYLWLPSRQRTAARALCRLGGHCVAVPIAVR